MTIQNFSPKYIKAKIAVKLDGATHELGEHLINKSGLPGIQTDSIIAIDNIGKKVTVAVKLLVRLPFEMQFEATIVCEQTERASLMGLNFILSIDQVLKFDQALAAEGTLPEFIRKFPRVPFIKKIGFMPFQVAILFKIGDKNTFAVGLLENISPTGLSVTFEDPRVVCLLPGEPLKIQFLPRGPTYAFIDCMTVVRRVTTLVDHYTSNTNYILGMSISGLDTENKPLFTHLLRKVIDELKVIGI